MILHFAFAGLGAEESCSSAMADNAASLRVSAKCGYAPDGVGRVAPRGTVVVEQRLRLTRDRWEMHRRDDIQIDGLADCRSWFGLD